MTWAKKFGINLVLMFVSIAIVTICFEILLRLTPYKSFIIQFMLPRYYFKIDSEAGYDIQENFQKAAAYIPAENFKYDIWSNDLGCFDLPYKGEKDFILLVGDSFTKGSCRFEDTYGVVIEQSLGYRVLKCGVGGYGTKQELIKAAKIISKIKASPKLIIVGYHMNDLEGDYLFPGATVGEGYLIGVKAISNRETGEVSCLNGNLNELLERWRKSGRPFIRQPTLIHRMKWWLTQHSILYMVSKGSLEKLILRIPWAKDLIFKFEIIEQRSPSEQIDSSFYSIDDCPWLKGAWKGHLQNLKAFKELAQQNGAKLLVVIIPAFEQAFPSFLTKYGLDPEQPNKTLHGFFKKEDIVYLDLLPVFRKYVNKSPRKQFNFKKDLYYWMTDHHWNANGHRLAGLLAARYILENNLIDIDDKDEKLKVIEEKLKDFR